MNIEKINKNILAIIPARGGSKGVPRKNVLPLGGRPVVAWTIMAAQRSKFVNLIAVSSEDEEVLGIANEHQVLAIKRPKALATDTAEVEGAVFHALEYLKRKKSYVPEIIVYLQPTSPLRDHFDIDSALDLFVQKNPEALIAVTPINKSYIKSFTTDGNGYLKAINRFPFMRRQDIPDMYLPNGAIYIIKTPVLIKNKVLFAKRTLPFVMPIEKSIDLDTPDDLAAIRKVIRNHTYAKKQ